jgi:hypothetical protein
VQRQAEAPGIHLTGLFEDVVEQAIKQCGRALLGRDEVLRELQKVSS